MSTTIEQQAEQRIRRHRARLLMTAPFYGSVGAELELVIDPNCGTAWTDGKAIGFNPEFALELTAEHLTGVVAHEILHVAMRHNYRRGARDHGLWNEACDYAINGVLVNDGFSLPIDALLDDRFDCLSAEQIYAILSDEQQEQEQEQGDKSDDDGESGDESGQQSGDQNGGGDESGDKSGDGDEGQDGEQGEGQDGKANGGSASQDDQGGKAQVGDVRDASDDAITEKDWETKVVTSGKLAKNLHEASGKASSGAAALAAKTAVKPTIDWRGVLQQFLTARTSEDYSWQRPSRRHLHNDLHMPSLHSDGAGVLALAIDTSGSIDQPALDRFLGELQGVVDQLNPERVLVLCCDVMVQGGVQTFERGEKIEPKILGGGGTDFAPAFKMLDETHEDVSAFIYFTDGEARMPKEEPLVPTLWAITTPQALHERICADWNFAEMPTFGEVIYLGDEG